MTEYQLKPRPGYDALAVHKNPTPENSDIFEFDDDGALREIYPTSPRTLHMLKPVMPPSFYRVERVMKKFSLDRELPEGKLASGISPHIQLIWKTVSDRGGGNRRGHLQIARVRLADSARRQERV